MKMPARKYLAIAALLFATHIATADSSDMQHIVTNSNSVSEAVDRVSARLTRQGFTLPLVVDHTAAAASVDLQLRPTRVIFARPPEFLEQSLLRRGATAGIDLPLKFLIFEDENGDVQLRTNPIGYLIDRHDLRINDFVLYLTGVLAEQFGEPADGLITVRSRRKLDATVEGLQNAIGANAAFRIPLVLDYGAARHRSGPVLIVFGNPLAGTPLMQATQEIALDLPQKFLVWRGRGHAVYITYNDPFFIADRANLSGQEERLQMISNALANFAAAGAGSAKAK